ncbi:hypothetical protein ACA910_019487 [Epithemia clementina (nom. ined.)]
MNHSTSSSSSQMNNEDNTMNLIREGNALLTPNANPMHLKKQDQPKAFWPMEEDAANVHLKILSNSLHISGSAMPIVTGKTATKMTNPRILSSSWNIVTKKKQ